MSTINLLCDYKDLDIKDFATKFFQSIGVVDWEERESSNYVDGIYFIGKMEGLQFKIALSDEVGNDDLRFWIFVECAQTFEEKLDNLVRSNLQPMGIQVAKIINFGKKIQDRIDY